jgi:hypothetical protein
VTLRPGQRKEAALLFAWNYCAVAAFFVGRSVRDALFLAHESPSRLPLMYVLSPLAVSAVGLMYARVADRVRRDRLVRATSVALAALALAAWWALGPRWVYYALYVGVEVMGALAMMQFWTSAGDRFSPREARRIFGIIAAGGTVANITVGVLISQLVTRTGAEALLLAVAGFLLAVALLSSLVARRPTARRAAPRPLSPAGPAPAVDPPGTGHLRLLGPMIACGVLASTLLDFQFKTIAAHTFAGDRVAMLRFFALLSSGIGAVSLFVQFFVTARVLERFGVTGALLFLPGTLGLSALGILASPTLPAATVSEAGDVFRYTLHDAAMQLLYLPVPAAARGRRKATIDGVIKPGTEALSGAALFGYRAVSGALGPLAVVSAVAACLWIVAVLRLRAAYARSLAETLRRRRIATGAPDDVVTRDIERAAREALRSGDPATLRHALDLARLAPRALDAELRALAAHPDAAIRSGALACLAPCGLGDAELDRALADADPGVRAAAARAAGPAQLDRVSHLLGSDEALLVAAAAEALHRDGDAAARARVASRASALLGDAAREARSLGLEVARRAPDAALLPALLLRFADRREARRAAEAAAAVGPAAEPALIGALASSALRPTALRALGRLGTRSALAAVAGALSADDEASRDAACEALARARAESPGVELPTVALVAACEAELARAFGAVAAAEGLGRDESALRTDGTRALLPYRPADAEGPAALISRALRERTERARNRVFHLLGAVQPELDLATVRANLDEPDPVRRANAVELLDSSDWARALAPLRPLLVALVEESPRADRLAAAGRRLKLPARTRDGWVEALLDDGSGWMVACAAYHAGAAEVLSVRPKLRALTADPRAVVRETAADALTRIEHPELRGPMITTAEKVLFLKGLELFATVPSEDLVELAGITAELAVDEEEEVFREGDRGDALFLVVEGSVRVSRGGRTLATMGEREVFGEMALLDPAPRSATATAATSVTLLRVAQEDFADLLRERPEVAAGVLRVLTRRLRAANERMDGTP